MEKREAMNEMFLERVDQVRRSVGSLLDGDRRGEMGQYMTPSSVARFMASMFQARGRRIRLLDAGAGIGSLSAAFVHEMCARKHRPERLALTTYEVDPLLLDRLKETMTACRRECEGAGIEFEADIHAEDFIEAGSEVLGNRLFAQGAQRRFDAAILNPPYRKINSNSRERLWLRRIGIETSNLYTGFLATALQLLVDRGEMVAITPRSFCNGPYFRPFREYLVEAAALRRIHVFESRTRAFSDDEVLQENVIWHAVRGGRRGKVVVSASRGPGERNTSVRRIGHDEVIHPGDPEVFIHIAPDRRDGETTRRMVRMPCALEELGLSVSTGRVVDFRAREYLRRDPVDGAVPLIYPAHFKGGFVAWPKIGGRKPNAILDEERTACLFVPNAAYVLVKRFSAKEERRRIVAAVCVPGSLPADRIGIENHLNYYHRAGRGLPLTLAKGLAAYLNSTFVDDCFRQFSGHTQVNATDLRRLRYPTRETLEAFGERIGDAFPDQGELDAMVKGAIGKG